MINEIDIREAKKCIDGGAVVLDVRTKEEYDDGHITGSVNIDIHNPDFEEKITNLDKERSYIVCCASGARSARATEVMENLGFEDVYNLSGGMTEWKKEGMEVEG